MTILKRSNGFYPTFNSVFNDFWGTNWALPVGDKMENTTPAVNVQEKENEYLIEVAAPGYTKQDFKVSIEKEVLTISVEKNEEKTEDSNLFKRKEFSYSSFVRKFNLPNDIVDTDGVRAQYVDGILTLAIPKREEVKPKPARMIDIH